MPWTDTDGSIYEGMEWPLPDRLSAHPRSSGTFTRFLRDYARDRQVMPLMEALARCTILPGKVIEDCAPQIRKKLRVQEGCDADLVVFDLQTLTDKADFENMNQPSEGVRYLIVNGVPVIFEGQLDTDAAPGKAIRRAA